MLHAAKRRKLDQPPASLNKPFRSPLPQQSRTQLQPSETPSRLKSSTLSSADDFPTGRHDSINTHSPEQENSDESYIQRQQSVLSRRQTQSQLSLNVVENALQVLSGNKGDELEKLITKWRQIAQDAADEVFSSTKERIDRMGGYAVVQRRAAEDAKVWNAENEWKPTKVEGEGETDANADSTVTSGVEGCDSGSDEGDQDPDDEVSQGRSCYPSVHTNVRDGRSTAWPQCSSR
jgi:hypothetical protein